MQGKMEGNGKADIVQWQQFEVYHCDEIMLWQFVIMQDDEK